MKKAIIGLLLVGAAIWGKIQMQEERERRERVQQMIYEATQKHR